MALQELENQINNNLHIKNIEHKHQYLLHHIDIDVFLLLPNLTIHEWYA